MVLYKVSRRFALYCNEVAMQRGSFRLAANEDSPIYETFCPAVIATGTKMRPLEWPKQARKIPVLLMSGSLDHATPDYFAEMIKNDFETSTSLIVEGVGHGVFFKSVCAKKAVADFLGGAKLKEVNCPKKTLDFIKSEDDLDFKVVEFDKPFEHWIESDNVPGYIDSTEKNELVVVLSALTLHDPKYIYLHVAKLAETEVGEESVENIDLKGEKWTLVKEKKEEGDEHLYIAIREEQGMQIVVAYKAKKPAYKSFQELLALIVPTIKI